jgi:signal transduction histidine kinase
LEVKALLLKDLFFKMKSVKSINQCESDIQTSYDIVKAHGGEIKVETLSAGLSVRNEELAEAAAQAGKEREARPDDPRLNDSVGQSAGRGTTFTISIPVNQ